MRFRASKLHYFLLVIPLFLLAFSACTKNGESGPSAPSSIVGPSGGHVNGEGYGGIIRIDRITIGKHTGKSGIEITIEGRNFSGETTVTVNQQSCSSVSVVSPTVIVCQLPNATVDTVISSVVVKSHGDEALFVVNNSVPVIPPTITAVTPNTAGLAGGTLISISGTGFTSGLQIKIGGSACTSLSISSPTLATCISPPGTGLLTLQVIKADGSYATLANALFYTPTLWTGVKQTGVSTAPAAVYGTAAASDSAGNLLISGTTEGGIEGNLQNNNHDFYVKKYSLTGNTLWVRQIGVGSFGGGSALTTDQSGNVFVTGRLQGGSIGTYVQQGNWDMFVAKLNSNGDFQWAAGLGVPSVLGGSHHVEGTAVAADAAGNIYVTGSTDGLFSGDPAVFGQYVFLAKYDSGGTLKWFRQLQRGWGNGVTVDYQGDIVVVGRANGSLDGATPVGTDDYFIVKYDTAGNRKFMIQAGVPSKSTLAQSVTTEASGNILVGGKTYGGLDGLTLTGTYDAFVVKYNSLGVRQWTRQYGVATKVTDASSISVNNAGEIFSGGTSTGNLSGEGLTGFSDAYLRKFDSSGTLEWTHQIGIAGQNSNAKAVIVDVLGNPYIVGDAYGNLMTGTFVGTPGRSNAFIAKYNRLGILQ